MYPLIWFLCVLKYIECQVLWDKPFILALGGQEQAELCEFKASLAYTVSFMTVWAMYRDPATKQNKIHWIWVHTFTLQYCKNKHNKLQRKLKALLLSACTPLVRAPYFIHPPFFYSFCEIEWNVQSNYFLSVDTCTNLNYKAHWALDLGFSLVECLPTLKEALDLRTAWATQDLISKTVNNKTKIHWVLTENIFVQHQTLSRYGP